MDSAGWEGETFLTWEEGQQVVNAFEQEETTKMAVFKACQEYLKMTHVDGTAKTYQGHAKKMITHLFDLNIVSSLNDLRAPEMRARIEQALSDEKIGKHKHIMMGFINHLNGQKGKFNIRDELDGIQATIGAIKADLDYVKHVLHVIHQSINGGTVSIGRTFG